MLRGVAILDCDSHSQAGSTYHLVNKFATNKVTPVMVSTRGLLCLWQC